LEYRLIFSDEALKDAIKLKRAKLDDKAKELLKTIKENPYQNPPYYEKLTNNLHGKYTRRINIKHRIVYEVINVYYSAKNNSVKEEKIVKIYRMWTHYE